MKLLFLILLSVLTLASNGADVRGFDHFSAPGIVGAYSLEWDPLGITDKGFDFSVRYYLKGTDESSPQYFWINKKTKALIEIDSIAAISLAINDFYGNSEKYPGNTRAPIEAARRLIAIQVASAGQTGLSLYFDSHQDLIGVVSRLKKAGLDEATAGLLLQLGEESVITENGATKEWSAMWYEIDRLGGVERVTIRGSRDPVKVVSVLHEAIFDAGKVNPAFLKRTNFVDVSLTR